jgi:biopolymer transport protein ExbB
MIETFDVISLYGTGNAKAMAGGISVALVTTQTGLLIAIPGLFLSGTLARLARQLTTRLEETAAVLDRALKNQTRIEEDPAK